VDALLTLLRNSRDLVEVERRFKGVDGISGSCCRVRGIEVPDRFPMHDLL
jgi:hypothetical protein